MVITYTSLPSVELGKHDYMAERTQQAATAYLLREQLLSFGFAVSTRGGGGGCYPDASDVRTSPVVYGDSVHDKMILYCCYGKIKASCLLAPHQT